MEEGEGEDGRGRAMVAVDEGEEGQWSVVVCHGW